MVVWNMKWSCVVPLCLLSMAQWAFIIRGSFPSHITFTIGITVNIKDAFSLRTTGQSGQSCEIIQISISGQSAKLSLGIFFDFVALILIVYKIFGFNHGTIKRSQLISILFQDGMIYFVASCVPPSRAFIFALWKKDIFLTIA